MLQTYEPTRQQQQQWNQLSTHVVHASIICIHMPIFKDFVFCCNKQCTHSVRMYTGRGESVICSYMHCLAVEPRCGCVIVVSIYDTNLLLFKYNSTLPDVTHRNQRVFVCNFIPFSPFIFVQRKRNNILNIGLDFVYQRACKYLCVIKGLHRLYLNACYRINTIAWE